MVAPIALALAGGVALIVVAAAASDDQKKARRLSDLDTGFNLKSSSGTNAFDQLRAAVAPYELGIDPWSGGFVWYRDGHRLDTSRVDAERYQALRDLHDYVISRLRARPGAPTGWAGDPLSNFKFSVPNCPSNLDPDRKTSNLPNCSFSVVDEWGRLWPGDYGGGSSFAGGLEYLVVQIAPYVALAYPPAAPLIYAALAAYKSRGEDLSAQDLAIAAAKSQVPPEYQAAFSFGVGIASGEDPEEAALNAFVEQYPQATPYVIAGRQAYAQSQT